MVRIWRDIYEATLHRLVGHETASAVLTWCLHALGQNPAIQSKLRDELLNFEKAEPTFDDFASNIPYLDAVCKEAMRMFPPSAHCMYF